MPYTWIRYVKRYFGGNNTSEKVKLGLYKHFKGNFYEVIGVATNPTTLKNIVVYKGLYNQETLGPGALWFRSEEEFLETVREGIPRFRFVGECSEGCECLSRGEEDCPVHGYDILG